MQGPLQVSVLYQQYKLCGWKDRSRNWIAFLIYFTFAAADLLPQVTHSFGSDK